MKWSSKYLWPLYAYVILNLLGLLVAGFGSFQLQLEYGSTISNLSSLLITLGGIYYLYTSPFGSTQFLPLATLIVIRYMIPIMMPFTFTTATSFYMGSNLAVLLFYCFRTLQKEPIRKVDYTKLLLLGGFIFLQVAYYAGLLYLQRVEENELPFPKENLRNAVSVINMTSLIFVGVLVFIHVNLIMKFEQDQLDKEEMDRIDEIGKEES